MANWWLQAESLLVVCHAGNDINLSVWQFPSAHLVHSRNIMTDRFEGTKKATEPQGPKSIKILCLIEMFSVFFRPFFTTGQPTAYGLPCSSPYFQSWNGASFFEDLWRLFCARLGLNTACKHACAVQKCAKCIKHFSILIPDMSRCFTLGLNLKENWKLHDVYCLFVSLQNRGYKETSGSRIWAETILTKVYKFIIKERSTKFSQQSREAKKNMHCQVFQCFSSLDFVYGTFWCGGEDISQFRTQKHPFLLNPNLSTKTENIRFDP